jgi:hypothetical protein
MIESLKLIVILKRGCLKEGLNNGRSTQLGNTFVLAMYGIGV